ncbi:MAG: DUF2313 domain-containing protein [[Actinobacillus] rossii]|nr:DUF2313 domain-containing protein [[Actinobacillus] rossii]
MLAQTRSQMITKIHIGKNQLKMTDNQYRVFLLDAVDKHSCAVMSDAELMQVLQATLNVIEPETSSTMLADWERLCGLKTDLTKSYSERVKRVIIQLNAVGGLSIPYFIRLAEGIGYQIKITEFSPLKNELPDPGDIVQFRNEPTENLIFMWRVSILNADSNIVYFRAGSSFAGDYLVEFGDPIVEEFFRDLKPAHTYCYFAYPTA